MIVLQLCQRPPFPPIDGGAIGMNNVTQGLLELGHEVKVLSIATNKHPVDLAKLNSEYVAKTNFESVYINTSIKASDALLNLFDSSSYNVNRFISGDFERKIIAILAQKKYDVVLLESLYVAPYIDCIRQHSKAKIVLRAPNVEYKIWERSALNASSLPKKWYLSLLAKRLKSYETKVLSQLDGLIPVTNEDLLLFQSMGYKGKGFSVPTGMMRSANKGISSVVAEENSVFHIASMNWQPNVEAVEWFLKNVWPLVLTKVDNATFYLAGRDMPQHLLQHKQKNVIVLGEVANANDFYASKKIMVVPLLSGSGMRVKIIEGMALGKAIVSTSIGAEGISCTNNKNIMIADSTQDFAELIVRLLSKPEICAALSREAKKLIEEDYDNLAICKKIATFLSAL